MDSYKQHRDRFRTLHGLLEPMKDCTNMSALGHYLREVHAAVHDLAYSTTGNFLLHEREVKHLTDDLEKIIDPVTIMEAKYEAYLRQSGEEDAEWDFDKTGRNLQNLLAKMRKASNALLKLKVPE